MKTRKEWAKELSDLGVSVCQFWKLDERGKEKFIEFLRYLKQKDDRGEEPSCETDYREER